MLLRSLALVAAGAAGADLKARFEQTYAKVVASLAGNFSAFPSKTTQQGAHFQWESSDDTIWTAGFFPGLLWQLASSTGDSVFEQAAANWTAQLEQAKTRTTTHDVGFVVFGSFGNGWQLVGHNETYKSVIVEAAHSLALRYSDKVGMTRSWGDIGDNQHFRVIIDNMLNLELLLWAGQETHNSTLIDMSVSHARKTAKYWTRADGSTPHLCVFDPTTGALQTPCTGTPQGLAANSTWARGQAWAIYGFTMMYRYTREAEFLANAEKFAEFYVKASPEDQVPLWDYDAKAPQAFKDTSAAAITASGLLELAVHTGKSQYKDEATKIIAAIEADPTLLAQDGDQAVLAANRHDCDADGCTIIETDYYMYEALRRVEGQFPPGVGSEIQLV
mmetsp:Transcript_15131/g.33391  ORF Transcript_15131/g.33391 Transcript_15131/m.33391 type:complete len:389 (-) Transcript_15131:109-1275(-)